ncbi:hypothetical protein PMAYCL1PPCAC_33307, partial [Pristionchus mayeri]
AVTIHALGSDRSLVASECAPDLCVGRVPLGGSAIAQGGNAQHAIPPRPPSEGRGRLQKSSSSGVAFQGRGCG